MVKNGNLAMSQTATPSNYAKKSSMSFTNQSAAKTRKRAMAASTTSIPTEMVARGPSSRNNT